jgi:ELWxxDGT repeat protein
MLAVLATSTDAAPPVARLVKDLDPEFERSPLDVKRPTMAGGKAFFSATTLEHGAELWVSSGKPAGTFRVADLYPGVRPSWPESMMEMGGMLYFSADDGVQGRELWRSDGSNEGTIRIADLFPGAGSGNPKPLAATSGLLWFTAETGKGTGLWCTNGTPEGTVELNPTAEGSFNRRFPSPTVFALREDALFFCSGSELWRSDGTLAGTVLLDDLRTIPNVGIHIPEMKVVGDLLYLVVDTAGRQWLWRTDGETGAAELVPREEGIESWEVFRRMLAVGDKLWFKGQTERGAEEVWRCGDGTLAGSERLPGTILGNQNETFVPFGDAVYYNASIPGIGAGLGRSDGTAAGTSIVNSSPPGNVAVDVEELTAAGKWLYFNADDPKRGREIWRSDGTAKGTRLVHETARGEGSTQPEAFTADGEAIYFLGGQLSPGGDLWRSDGTKKGSIRLTVPEQKGRSGLAPAFSFSPPIVALGNKVFFNAGFSKFGIEPWTSDGTFKGTKPVGDTIKGGSANCDFMTRLGKRILYTTNTSFAASQVWASNGSKAGTVPLTKFTEDEQGFPSDFTVDGERMFFTSGQSRNTLWVTDGTPKETREIPIPGNTPLNVVGGTLRMAGPTLFFAQDRRPLRHELWRSDGTPAGTVMVRDAFPAAVNGEKPRLDQFTALGNSICFFSKTTDSARLWRSDGTAEGTLEVTIDFAPGSYFRVLTAVPFGDRFLFLADAQNGGLKWWISDGTTEGTRILKDLSLTPGLHFQPGQVPESAVIDGILYWVIDTQAQGQELWRTDGSQEGTSMVADLFPGPEDSNPAGFQVHGGRLYFAASDPFRGRELWSSDGTGAGTSMIAEVMTGDRSSNPAMICVAGKQLFFGAEDPVAGYELHVLDLPEGAGSLAGIATRSRSAGASTEAGQGASVIGDDDSLLRLAFNLDPSAAGRPVLEAGHGTSGYPSFTRSPGVFLVEYLRRRDGRFSYVPKWSTTLESGSFVAMDGPESVVEINAEWERVSVGQAVLPGTTRMFGVVEVTEN